MNTYYTGIFSEWRAKMFLRFHGYKILKSRYVTGKNTNRAEIDIIAKYKNTIVFVEVKYRPDLNTAWNAITPHQMQRLRNAANTYLIKTHWTGDARFDVIAVCGWKMYWAKSAF
jgi:putative endonuclease